MNRTPRALAVGVFVFLLTSCGQGDLPLETVDPAAAPLAPTFGIVASTSVP